MQKLEECKKVLIEVNQTCNLNCTYCFYRDYGREKSSLNLSNIENLFETCPNAEEFYLTGGECFTSPYIDQIIQILSINGKVIIFTNGVMLNKYDENRLINVVSNVDRFIISFDSFDFENYNCRQKLNETLETIKRIIIMDSSKLEVKICINKDNENNIEEIIKELISLGLKYLSVNFVFDIKNSNIYHEVKDLKELRRIFEILYKYKNYFNVDYINVLYDLYINGKINENFPCLADKEYCYLDCNNQMLICPGNCKKLGNRGNWKKCFSKECANEWEIMYMR